ncbi:hypothetical protein Tco_0685987 [Tanacetum coccineum]
MMANLSKNIQSASSDTRPLMLDRETLAEGALHLGPERDKVVADLTPEEEERYKADIRAMLGIKESQVNTAD